MGRFEGNVIGAGSLGAAAGPGKQVPVVVVITGQGDVVVAVESKLQKEISRGADSPPGQIVLGEKPCGGGIETTLTARRIGPVEHADAIAGSRDMQTSLEATSVEALIVGL